MKAFLRLPKHQIILILLVLLFGALTKLGFLVSLTLAFLTISFCVIFDMSLTYIRKKTFFIPRSAIITGLILTLIIDPTATWYQILVIALAAMLIKNFIRLSNKHILNPAASGLFIGWIFFGVNPSWWAAAYNNPNVIFSLENLPILFPILLISYVSMYKYRRYYSVISYSITYILLMLLTHLSSNLLTTIATVSSIGTIFYMTLMLVEPMTSPVKKKRQILYGASVAVLTILFMHIQKLTGVPIFDVSLAALLLGNLFFFKFR